MQTATQPMIEASELRIGNYLKISDRFIRVYSVNCGFVGYEANEEAIDIMAYEPIPLTAEILEKCGFERMAPSFFYMEFENGNQIQLHEDYLLLGGPDSCTGGMNFDVQKCQYLHQLQNLYFALTSEELNIKL